MGGRIAHLDPARARRYRSLGRRVLAQNLPHPQHPVACGVLCVLAVRDEPQPFVHRLGTGVVRPDVQVHTSAFGVKREFFHE